jgi:hypothetical protein
VALAVVAIADQACLGPTEILVSVRTNAPCTDPKQWQGVAIYVGEPGSAFESSVGPAAAWPSCDSSGAAGSFSNVGSVMLVPTSARDAEVAIRVVAGLTVATEQCTAPEYQGCIVARRTLSYLPHQMQSLDIDLTVECVSVGCDALHTCYGGECVGTSTSAAPESDAGVDPFLSSVRCGDNLRCPLGDPNQVCCAAFDLDAGTGQGSCIPTLHCPSTSSVYKCDKASDCVAVGTPTDPGVCCESINFSYPPTVFVALTECLTQSVCIANANESTATTVCDDRQSCSTVEGGAQPCVPDPGSPGYFTCIYQ